MCEILALITTDYDDSGSIVGLDVTDVVMSDYALELAAISPFKIKLKAIASSVYDKFNEHQENLNSRVELYDQYSDEQLKQLAKRNSFSSTTDRMAVAIILKERGYSNEKQHY